MQALNQNQYQCDLCYSGMSTQEYMNPKCGHKYCKNCLCNRHVPDENKIKCFVRNCESSINVDDLDDHFFQLQLQQLEQIQIEKKERCPIQVNERNDQNKCIQHNVQPKYDEKMKNYDDGFIQHYHCQQNMKNQPYQTNNLNIDEMLEFSIGIQYSRGKLLKNSEYYLPGIISIKAIENIQKPIKIGVDLICLIDKSESMLGEKIEMVRKTLLNLLDYLSEKDRLCLIQFDDRPRRLTPLKTVSKDNLNYFKIAIKNIVAGGKRKIGNATATAIEQIKKRKYQNNVTSIFLLSDGQDVTAAQQVSEQFKFNNDVFTIHTFGYGSEHDPKLMTQLCNLRNGSFYFVNDVKLLDQYFVDAFGGLKSVVAEQIEIKIKCQPRYPFENINISKTYGNIWREKKKGKEYQIHLTHLGIGRRKDFVFELLLPKFDQKILDEQRNCQVLEAEITLKSTQSQQIIKRQAELSLTFYNENEQILQNEENIDVATQFYRVKGADVIDDARKKCEQNQFEMGEHLIEQAIKMMKTNERVAKASQDIIDDLEQAQQASKPKNFLNYGSKQMCQMVSNNYCQEGINAMFDDNGIQDEKRQKFKFSNRQQIEWVKQVQKSNKHY